MHRHHHVRNVVSSHSVDNCKKTKKVNVNFHKKSQYCSGMDSGSMLHVTEVVLTEQQVTVKSSRCAAGQLQLPIVTFPQKTQPEGERWSQAGKLTKQCTIHRRVKV